MRIFLSILLFSASLPCVFPQLHFRYDVKLGIDVLQEQNFQPLWHKRIALVANHSSRNRYSIETAKLLAECDSCRLMKILTPEHGYYALSYRAGEKVDTQFSLYGVPVRSIYAANLLETELDSIDIVVFDLQDIGIRSYTYLGTLHRLMDVCAKKNIPLIVCDRPNPLGGEIIDGNLPDSAYSSLVNPIPIPYIHGCTIGEIARMINEEGWLSYDSNALPRQCSLRVIPMENWERWMQWEDTDFLWIPTSPHIPSVTSIRGAAMLGVLGELGIFGIGIGTTLPFQALYHPQFDVRKLEEILQQFSFSDMVYLKTSITPFYGLFAQQRCPGFLFLFPPRIQKPSWLPYTAGIQLLHILIRTFPELLSQIPQHRLNMFQLVTGSKKLRERVAKQESLLEFLPIIKEDAAQFRTFRQKYLLYP